MQLKIKHFNIASRLSDGRYVIFEENPIYQSVQSFYGSGGYGRARTTDIHLGLS